MKLVITTDNFLPRKDGVAIFLKEIIPRLQKSYDITVISPDFGAAEIKGIRHIKIPLSGKIYGDYPTAKWAYKQIAPIIKDADRVFNQSHGPIGISAIRAARKYKKPIATFIHNIEWELFSKASTKYRLLKSVIVKIFIKHMYKKSDLLIVPSETIAELLEWNHVRVPKAIVHLGVDVSRFKKGHALELRKSLGIDKHALVIGYHGRIAHEKNIHTLLRAYRMLKEKNKALLVIGDGVTKIKESITRTKGGIVTGMVEKPELYLPIIDIYVQPSLTETTSLSVLEAMACEIPVISSRVGFIKEYIIDGENGFFFDKRNSYDLFKKMEELLSMRRKWVEIGKAARLTVVKGFHWEKTAEGIKHALESI